MAVSEVIDDMAGRYRKHKGALGFLEKSLLISIPVVGILFILKIYEYVHLLFYKEQYLALFIGLILAAVFLVKPARKKGPFDSLPWYDAILSLLSVIGAGYLVIYWPQISASIGQLSLVRVILGTITVALVLEATRRIFGWFIVGAVLLFIFYALFSNIFPGALGGRPIPFPRLMSNLYLDTNGLMGAPIDTAATVALAFILFGRFLFATGGGQWLIDLALSAMGRFTGGAGKAATVASGLFGMISGIAVANVATTGTVTIPMMKKHGFTAEEAAGIESAAATGGLIMPPIMGVVAFIMAIYLGISYAAVCIMAAVPALLYYFGIFMQIHFFSARQGYGTLRKEEIPSLIRTLRDGWIYFIPILVLVYTMFILWLDAPICGILSAFAAILASFLKKGFRLNLGKFLKALEEAGQTILEIGIVCGAAGLIVGVVLFTGLGSSFAQILTEMSGGNLFILLILAAIANIILGMGMPIITVYIIVVVLVTPALIAMGVAPGAAHLFVIYFGMVSFLTPPVCLSVYAAMAIANARMWPTAVRGLKLSIAAYLVPFFFVYNPNLLLIGSPLPIVIHVITAFIGLLLISAGLEGYLFQNTGWVKRVLFIIAGIALMAPSYMAELGGGALGIFLTLWEWLIRRKASIQLRQAEMVTPSSPLDTEDADKGGVS